MTDSATFFGAGSVGKPRGSAGGCFRFGASYVSKEYNWGSINVAADATYYYHVSQQNTVGGQVLNVTDSLAPSFPVSPDFKLTASLFYSKTLFGIDTFQTGVTFNFIDSEHDVNVIADLV